MNFLVLLSAFYFWKPPFSLTRILCYCKHAYVCMYSMYVCVCCISPSTGITAGVCWNEKWEKMINNCDSDHTHIFCALLFMNHFFFECTGLMMRSITVDVLCGPVGDPIIITTTARRIRTCCDGASTQYNSIQYNPLGQYDKYTLWYYCAVLWWPGL